jgi:hypothetical protein
MVKENCTGSKTRLSEDEKPEKVNPSSPTVLAKFLSGTMSRRTQPIVGLLQGLPAIACTYSDASR